MRECKCDVNWIVKSIRCDVFYSTDDVVGSKMACEMLCFTIETAAVGHAGRSCETVVAGYVRAMSAPRSFGSAGWFRVGAVESNVWSTVRECNCRLLDAF